MKFMEYETNFDLIKEISSGSLETLNILENYLDYAIHKTIIKQIPDISSSEEKFWAEEILTKFLDGDTNIFTSDNGIRTNMNSISNKKIYQMLIKNAIEFMAYKEKVLFENDTYNNEFILSYITNKIYYNEYDEVRGLITVDSNYKPALINNYLNFKYGSLQKSLIERISIDGSIPKCREALQNLEFNIKKNI